MNWSAMIKDLIDAGIKQVDIAREIGLTPPSIIDISTGRQQSVRWEVGTRLIAMHSRYCQRVN